MTSQARSDANRRNAAKSTGPRTEAGKERSRMNALLHGMTASVPVLPDEDAEEFETRREGWFDHFKPRNDYESFLVESTARLAWQLKRLERGGSGRLVYKAHTKEQDEQNRVEHEVAELGEKLFRAPFGQPAALARDETAGQVCEVWKAELAPGDHPARVVRQLEQTGAGCRWLLKCWHELRSILEEGRAWQAPERFKALRLSGIHPIDDWWKTGLAEFLRACEVIDPEAGDIMAELWNAPTPTFTVRSLGVASEVGGRPPTSEEAAARAHLLEVVAQATERLEEWIAWEDHKAELNRKLAYGLNAFDFSKEGERLRRYEMSCERQLHRHLDELRKLRLTRARDEADGIHFHSMAPLPRARRIVQPAISSETPANGRLPEIREMPSRPVSRRLIAEPKASDALKLRNEATEARPVGAASVSEEPKLRNEPTEAGAAVREEQPKLRNEAIAVGSPMESSAHEPTEGVKKVLLPVQTILASELVTQNHARHRTDAGLATALTGSRGQRKRRERKRRNAERAAARARGTG